jgi:hypothetical protein
MSGERVWREGKFLARDQVQLTILFGGSMRLSTNGRTGTTRLTTVLLSATAALAVACGGERATTGPRLPGNPPPNPQILSAAFIADVNLRTGKIKITEPQSPLPAAISPLTPGGFSGGGLRKPGEAGPELPYRSIIAGDVIELTASNYSASAVGQFTPNKIRVSFDINITNRLASVELITPTFPTPPAGVSGVFLFPYSAVATVTTGGVSVGGDGTEVIVEQPSYGAVDASIAWEGAPHNFFNDGGCAAGANDCFRYEAYAQPLAAGATSEARGVGFDIDPTVGSFRARLIVAADLRNSGAAPTGSIAGLVSSPQRGPLAGVLATVTSGGLTGTTDASGNYSVSGVATGPKSVSLSNLPSGCIAPVSQSVTVPSGGTATANFSVQCSVPSGSIGGTISSSQGGGLGGVSVTATPTGGSAVAAVSTSGSGAYSIPSVPVGAAGTGSLALGNLPTNCTNPGAIAYSGLTNGGSITVDVTVSCAAPPQGYPYTLTWTSISAGQVTLTVRINMSGFDDPAIPGADDIDAIQTVTVLNNASRLQFVSAANGAGSGLQNLSANGGTPGQISWLNFSTNSGVATQQGLQTLAVFTFNVLAGAPATVTTSSSFLPARGDAAASRNGTDLIPRILVTEGSLSLP